jgi:hypothetical protein
VKRQTWKVQVGHGIGALGMWMAALVPGVAEACPACAREGNSSAVAWLIGGMIVAPLLLGGAIVATARTLPPDDRERPR